MKLTNDKDTSYTLKLPHKELKVIERALNYADDYNIDEMNQHLFDCDEFKSKKKYEKFESKLWSKIVKKTSTINVY